VVNLVSFTVSGKSSFGAIDGARVFDLAPRLPGIADLRALLCAGGFAQARKSISGADADFDAANVRFDPVIPHPSKILCIGLNYEDHRAETQRARTDHPTVFTRFADTQVGHEGNIIKPRHSNKVDYEAELALVIGIPGRDIPAQRALEHVAGFSCYNDVSIRDYQNHTTQFTPGKNFPGTGAFGPALVSPEDVGPLGAQRIQSRLNGKVMQDATLGQMIFPVPALIAYISQWTHLNTGDVIITGTPGGVGVKRVPPVYLRNGDEIIVEIGGVGLLRNLVVAESVNQ
jgi:2-keto-4-pentenoate hydratase/2-oxohepta-3-ene-1,7-dioic acid hydratase in catechol pathway